MSSAYWCGERSCFSVNAPRSATYKMNKTGPGPAPSVEELRKPKGRLTNIRSGQIVSHQRDGIRSGLRQPSQNSIQDAVEGCRGPPYRKPLAGPKVPQDVPTGSRVPTSWKWAGTSQHLWSRDPTSSYWRNDRRLLEAGREAAGLQRSAKQFTGE